MHGSASPRSRCPVQNTPHLLWFPRNEFTLVNKRDGRWFLAWSPAIPSANVRSRTLEECRESLGAAVQRILEDRRIPGPEPSVP